MSHKVVTLVCSRVVGSAAQKAVLVNMADKASDGGEGVFASKATIAAETELSRATVFRAIDQLIEQGLIKEVGQRPCLNGHTVVYDLDMGAIAALPEWKKPSPPPRPVSQRDQSHGETGLTATRDPSHGETPTRLTVRPKPSLEPSRNQGGGEEGARASAVVDAPRPDPSLVAQLADALGFNGATGTGWPRYWVAADAALVVARWKTDLGLTDDEVLQVATANMRAHGSPANGPKTLTRHMQAYADAKAAPRLEINPAAGGIRHDRATASDRRETAASDRLRREIDVAARMRRPSSADMP